MILAFGCQRSWTSTLLNAIGVSLVNREPVPPPPGLAIYVAPNGSDANSGTTPATSVATFDQAVIQAGVFARDIIRFVLNGALTPIWTVPVMAPITLSATFDLYAEPDVIPILSSASFPGANIVFRQNSSATGIVLDVQTGCDRNWTATNCSYTKPVNIGQFFGPSSDTAFSTFVNCFLASTDTTTDWCLEVEANISVHMTRCIAVPPIGTLGTTPTYGVLVRATFGGTFVVGHTFDRCTFAGTYGIGFFCGVGIVQSNICTFTSCAWWTARALFTIVKVGLFVNLLSDVSLTNCFTGGVAHYFDPSPPSTGIFINVTETSPVNAAAASLYLDPNAGLAGDPQGFRLQHRGQQVPALPDRVYALSSQLIGAGIAGVDVNPYDETITFNGTTFTRETPLRWEPSSHTREDNPQDTATLVDTNGSPHADYTRSMAGLRFTWSSYAGNETANRIQTLQADRGTKLWYPWNDKSSHMTQATTGDWDPTTSTLAPYLSVVAMDDDHWQYWLIKIQDGATTWRGIITTNDTTTFTIVDIFGTGLPTTPGNYNFSIPAILVIQIPQTVTRTQQHYTAYKSGGSWGERPDNWPDLIPQDTTFEYRGISLSLSPVGYVRDFRDRT